MLCTEGNRQGPLAERLRTPWPFCFLWDLCFGKAPFLRLVVTVRKASWGTGLGLPNDLVLFLSWRIKGNAKILFALPSAFKGSEV